MRPCITIFESKCADNIPADASDVDPAHFDPWLTGRCLVVSKKTDEPAIGHAAKAASERRVVDDIDGAILADVSVRNECAMTARVDARFGAQTTTRSDDRRAMNGDDQSDGRAKAIFRRWRWLGNGALAIDLATFATQDRMRA